MKVFLFKFQSVNSEGQTTCQVIATTEERARELTDQIKKSRNSVVTHTESFLIE